MDKGRVVVDEELEKAGRIEMEAGCALSTSKRQPVKTPSHFNTYPSWKHKLRENCFKRVREDRNRLLWKTRLSSAQSLNHKDYIKSAFEDIVSDELKKIKNSSLNDHSKISTSAVEANDMLWEYDGPHDPHVECEEILLEMQRIFYEDLREEKTTKKEPENYIETWEEKEDEYLARAVYEHMHLTDEQARKKTWCPICKQGELQENRQLIYCSLCQLQLSKCDEVNLDILQSRLAEAHVEHLDGGCRLKPKFCVETKFGLNALYIFCEECNIFDVVI